MIAIRRVRLVILALTCLLGVSAIPASPALAATTCNNVIHEGVTIQGNLTVPTGASCGLYQSTVTGNVTVGVNAYLQVGSSTIQGKVGGDGVLTVLLNPGTVVKGSVTVSGATGVLVIDESRVNGNVTFTGNTTAYDIAVRNSTIGGNLTISGNTSELGVHLIENNTIRGNLSCEGNSPEATGSGNVVSGRKTGQCAAA